MVSRWVRPCALAVVVATLAACSTGPYVWVDSLPQTPTNSPDSVLIQDGDVVNVRVFNQEPLSTREKVRADGKISMPVIGEVMARGQRPAQLAADIQERLKAVVVAPSVTVTLEAGTELKVSVLGEVRNAGIYQLDPGANVLQALAAAGGLSEYAERDKIFVVRRALPERVRFDYKNLRSGDARSIGFALQPGDIVVVE
ncbi:MAG TPA: polysaccharide biosynthesis/export family protein [Labilithrix sp.]|jgi:polysaccharide export outer membrane protein|nr:polysaccharide biosynthesis/export family protein [Labilithrix sp.]